MSDFQTPKGDQEDQSNSPGPQERTQPGAGAGAEAEAGAGWMPWGQMRENVAALFGLSRGSLHPAPEGSESPQAAQEPPSPGDSLPRAEPIPALSLPLLSPLGPRGSPCRQCSLGASSTATLTPCPHGLSSSPRSEDRAFPISCPHGLSSFPSKQRPPGQPLLALLGEEEEEEEEEEEGHPSMPLEGWEALLLMTDSESASSRFQDLSSSDDEEDDQQSFVDALEDIKEGSTEAATRPVPAPAEEEALRQESVLLHGIRRRLEDSSREVFLQGLLHLREIMAAPMTADRVMNIALLLGPKLTPLFDDESSQVRELSISLFEGVMEAMKSRRETWMKVLIKKTLISLFLRMNDSTESVAEASGKALLASAKFLGWRKLLREVQNMETWRIGETLLEQDNLWVREYLYSSQTQLKDTQHPRVRLETVRFMGAAVQRLSWNTDMGVLEETCNALQSLENDPDASVRSLAAQTLLILRTEMEQEGSGLPLRALCCCLR